MKEYLTVQGHPVGNQKNSEIQTKSLKSKSVLFKVSSSMGGSISSTWELVMIHLGVYHNFRECGLAICLTSPLCDLMHAKVDKHYSKPLHYTYYSASLVHKLQMVLGYIIALLHLRISSFHHDCPFGLDSMDSENINLCHIL